MTETTSPSSTSVQPKLGFVRMRDTSRVLEGATAYSRVVGLCALGFAGLRVGLVCRALDLADGWQAQIGARLWRKPVPNLVVENLRMTGVDKNDEPLFADGQARALQVQDFKKL